MSSAGTDLQVGDLLCMYREEFTRDQLIIECVELQQSVAKLEKLTADNTWMRGHLHDDRREYMDVNREHRRIIDELRFKNRSLAHSLAAVREKFAGHRCWHWLMFWRP